MTTPRGPVRFPALAALCVLLLGGAALAGCGDDDAEVGTGGTSTSTPSSSGGSPSTGPGSAGTTVEALWGREFVSADVRVDGEPYALVEGTELRAGFEDGSISLSAGCNQMSGSVTLEGDRLTVGPLASTMMGCEEPLMAQDEWLASLLAEPVVWLLDGDTLVLTTDDGTVITFTDREVAEPDLVLVGPLWSLETIITGDTASNSAWPEAPTMQFAEDGTVAVFDGCNRGSGAYTVDGDQLTIGPVGLTRMACGDDTADAVAAMAGVIGAEPLTFEIDADVLSLRAASGDGIDLRGTEE